MISFGFRFGFRLSLLLALAVPTIAIPRQAGWAQAPQAEAVSEELLPPPRPEPPRATSDGRVEASNALSGGVDPRQLETPPPPVPDVEELGPVDLWRMETEEPEGEGYDVLLQGPVHEAFAMPADVDPRIGVRVFTEAPPEPIDEKPPELAPGREGLTWIPGYWSWSDEVDKYVWVSGLYRQVPPGRSWVPGFWSASGSGYRWTNGYWISRQLVDNETRYLPLPPSSIDNGPSVPPPGDGYFWLPGHWVYAGDHYQWQSGYWAAYQEGWVWQPACYVYSPQGFVFVDGYWDVLPTQRGQLFAPVVFGNPVYQRPNYVYRPQYSLVDPAALLLHMFTRPGYPQYYYGNYYGANQASRGYRPWYNSNLGYGLNSQWIDYYNWNYGRSGIDFVGSMQRYNDFFRNSPGQTQKYLKQARGGGAPIANYPKSGKNPTFARSLDQLVQREVGGKAMKTFDPRSSGNPWQQLSSGKGKGSDKDKSPKGFSMDFDQGKSSNKGRGSASQFPQAAPSMKPEGNKSNSNRGGDSKSKPPKSGGNDNSKSKSSSGKGKGKGK